MKAQFLIPQSLRRLILAVVLLALAFPGARIMAAENEPNSVSLTAGPDWIALKPELDIEPGSALDFSSLGFNDAPAGKHGRVIARPDGHFAFSDSPNVPRRFYGVNFCFGALYLSHAEVQRLSHPPLRARVDAGAASHNSTQSAEN